MKTKEIKDQIRLQLKERDVVLSYVMPTPLYLRGDTKIRTIGYGYVVIIQGASVVDLSFEFLSDSVLQDILNLLLPEETKVIQLHGK